MKSVVIVSFHYCPVPWCIVHFIYHIAKGWEKAGIAQLLDESFSLSLEDPFEEIEGSIEIS